MFRRRIAEPAPSTSVKSIEELTAEVVQLNASCLVQVQDVETCQSTLDDLNQLSGRARRTLAQLTTAVEQLSAAVATDAAAGSLEQQQQEQLVAGHKQQLRTCQLQLRRASVVAHAAIERKMTCELLSGADSSATANVRTDMSRETLLGRSVQLSDSLRAINQQLAAQVERSRDTLDVLVTSSEKVDQNSEELRAMGGVIGQSHHLLSKYSRREHTDNILFILALVFFLACVLYVVKKRLWGW